MKVEVVSELNETTISAAPTGLVRTWVKDPNSCVLGLTRGLTSDYALCAFPLGLTRTLPPTIRDHVPPPPCEPCCQDCGARPPVVWWISEGDVARMQLQRTLVLLLPLLTLAPGALADAADLTQTPLPLKDKLLLHKGGESREASRTSRETANRNRAAARKPAVHTGERRVVSQVSPPADTRVEWASRPDVRLASAGPLDRITPSADRTDIAHTYTLGDRVIDPVDHTEKTLRLTGRREVGNAAWYGRGFVGLHTASGTVLDRIRPTAAHRSLPLNSLARVTNLRNGRSIIVLVNDRGPVSRSLIIDLSPGAAAKLDMQHDGVVPVAVEPIGAARLASR